MISFLCCFLALVTIPFANSLNCVASEWYDTDNSICKPCDAGSYCPGDDSKHSCPAGNYSTSGQSSCPQCLGGTYSELTGSISCTNCVAGTFSLDNFILCSPCPSGKFFFRRIKLLFKLLSSRIIHRSIS